LATFKLRRQTGPVCAVAPLPIIQSPEDPDWPDACGNSNMARRAAGAFLRSRKQDRRPRPTGETNVIEPATPRGPEPPFRSGRRWALADQVSALWAKFARRGVPSAPGVPVWKPYDSAKRPTMILDDQSRMADDPRGEQRRLMLSFGSLHEAFGRPEAKA
jgi:hypothetical protein